MSRAAIHCPVPTAQRPQPLSPRPNAAPHSFQHDVRTHTISELFHASHLMDTLQFPARICLDNVLPSPSPAITGWRRECSATMTSSSRAAHRSCCGLIQHLSHGQERRLPVEQHSHPTSDSLIQGNDQLHSAERYQALTCPVRRILRHLPHGQPSTLPSTTPLATVTSLATSSPATCTLPAVVRDGMLRCMGGG